ncbi:S9 family peptidase [Shouchella lehensis]|uniref:Peptidase S9, prolyl oligopeptidase n=1 Tax=Shouchella lehensis G1 TaxID=1246626 RepID=A0A060LWT8_9BACI|nr:S9 family peptidase [Shouchella lehensis]AIC92758.1 peptidase S9, prolyl oligopeptidase [Shouchella lehensis G1]
MNESGYLSVEELVSMPTLFSGSISEDGKKVAFVKRTANWKADRYDQTIWIYEKEKNRTDPFMTGRADCTQPLWSPNGEQIAYLSFVEKENHKKQQIIVQTLDSNCSVFVINVKEAIHSFKWAPDGNGIFYRASVNSHEWRKERYKSETDMQYVGKDYQNDGLYYVKLGEDCSTLLTNPDKSHVLQFDVSHDGNKIAYMATPTSDNEESINGELFIVDVKTRETRRLETNKLLGGMVCFSPDDKKICYTASVKNKDSYHNQIQDQIIEIYELDSGKRIQPLINVDSTITPIRWTEKGLFIRWQRKTHYLIGMISKDDGSVEIISKDSDRVVMEAAITKSGEHISYISANHHETFDVYLNGLKVTNENDVFHNRDKSSREIIFWQNHDGDELEGVLSTPVNFDKNKQYPLLVVAHGGPAWASFPIFSGCFNEKYPIEWFVEKGFIVLEPNYRGSSGYGNEFLKANYRKLGFAYYEDVVSGIDFLVEKGMVDEDRVGIMGWSNGGYVSAFCATFSHRFKAASVGGGITNWYTHYVHTDIPSIIRSYFGADPWKEPEIYRKTSPTTYISTASTPILIQHGEKDLRVPLANSYELYKGLKNQGVATDFIVYHGMAYQSEKPSISVAIMNQNLDWFSHYLLDEEMDGY